VTEKTNPNGTVDYFVYSDALNEVHEYERGSDGVEPGPSNASPEQLATWLKTPNKAFGGLADTPGHRERGDRSHLADDLFP
jgi:hypothetical protein